MDQLCTVCGSLNLWNAKPKPNNPDAEISAWYKHDRMNAGTFPDYCSGSVALHADIATAIRVKMKNPVFTANTYS